MLTTGRVLVTGFDPFGGDTENPSALLAAAFDGKKVCGESVVGVELPCVFGDALDRLLRSLEEHQPALVICVGQAGGRPSVCVERVAINVDDARFADNVGASPIDEPIVKRGPVGYWSTLPIKAIVSAIRRDGLPAEVSQTAGTFVCNHVFYGLMHELAKRARRGEGPPTRGGFIHVPFTPAQAARYPGGAPSLSLAKQERALEIAISTSLTVTRDIKRAEGATH